MSILHSVRVGYVHVAKVRSITCKYWDRSIIFLLFLKELNFPGYSRTDFISRIFQDFQDVYAPCNMAMDDHRSWTCMHNLNRAFMKIQEVSVTAVQCSIVWWQKWVIIGQASWPTVQFTSWLLHHVYVPVFFFHESSALSSLKHSHPRQCTD